MPYHVGEKGSYGCSGYPAVKEGGEVMGCHETEAEALAQVQAITISETEKSDQGIAPTQTSQTLDPRYPGVGIKRPSQGGKPVDWNIKSKYAKKPKINGGRSGDATGSAGSISSGGSGGSMGAKSDGLANYMDDSIFEKEKNNKFWSGSAFEKL